MTERDISDMSKAFRRNLDIASKEVHSWDDAKKSGAQTAMNVRSLASFYEKRTSEDESETSRIKQGDQCP